MISSLIRPLIRRFSLVVITACLGGAFLAGIRLPDLSIDASTDTLLNENDPDLAYYYRTRPDWGYDEYALFCVTGNDWFSPEGVQRLKEIRDHLTRQEAHVSTIVSLLDLPLLRQKPGFDLGRLLRPVNLLSPKVDFDKAREEILEHLFARKNLVSPDGKTINFLVYLDIPPHVGEFDLRWYALQGSRAEGPGAQEELEKLRPERNAIGDLMQKRRVRFIAHLRDAARKYDAHLSGLPAINVNLVEHVEDDIRTFGLLSFVFFFLAFLIVYRRPSRVVLPLMAAALPVFLVLGTMAAWNMSLSVITSNLPVLLFVLMLPYTVYLMERLRERRGNHPDEMPLEAISRSAGATWTPCFFSCITTMAGFASLATSGIKPVRWFGLMMAAGMGIGLLLVFLFLPSAFRLFPMPPGERRENLPNPCGIVRLFSSAALAYPGWIIVLGILALAAGAWGASRLNAETKFTEYFRSGSEVHTGLETVDRRIGGTTPLEIILESDKPNFFLSKRGIQALRSVSGFLEEIPEAGGVQSLDRIVSELEKANPKVAGMAIKFGSRIPAMRAILSTVVANGYSTARITVRFRETAPTLHRNNILKKLRAHFETAPELKGLRVRETGVFLLYANMLQSLLQSQKETFLVVILAVLGMLVILFRNPFLALIVLLPQVLPAVVMLGIMGWTGIPLDLVTVMIASIAMGVGIDASIQYTFRYRMERHAGIAPREALLRAHATTGRAIWIATSVIVAGFCVLIFSRFVPSVWFGLFTAIAMLISQLAALTLLPSLLLLTGLPRVKTVDRSLES